MKTWQKILSGLVIVLALIMMTVLAFRERPCCVCSSFRYYTPCLIDLKTGEVVELDLYFPHPTKVAELADPQHEMGTFSYIRLGSVTGTRLTDIKIISLDVPNETVRNHTFCQKCKNQLDDSRIGRYILTDLYDMQVKTLIPIVAGKQLNIRCYEITMLYNVEVDIVDETIQGSIMQ